MCISKQNHFAKIIEEDTGNTCKLWKHIRSVSGKNASQAISVINDCNNECITDSKNIANEFNTYFSNITENLNISQDTTNCQFENLEDFISSHIPENVEFTMPFMTENFVLLQLLTLNESKATGLDSIGAKFLKMSAHTIAAPLCHIFNLSIRKSVFPSLLKIAKVIPVYKNRGSKHDVSNYRPIAILPLISKIIERHVKSHLMNFLNKYNLYITFSLAFVRTILVKPH